MLHYNLCVLYFAIPRYTTLHHRMMLFYILYAPYATSILYALYYALCAMYYVLCTMYYYTYTLYDIHDILQIRVFAFVYCIVYTLH